MVISDLKSAASFLWKLDEVNKRRIILPTHKNKLIGKENILVPTYLPTSAVGKVSEESSY